MEPAEHVKPSHPRRYARRRNLSAKVQPFVSLSELGIRCRCSRFVIVFTGSPVPGRAYSRARELAREINARFIDGRKNPWAVCDCGQLLQFTPDESPLVQ